MASHGKRDEDSETCGMGGNALVPKEARIAASYDTMKHPMCNKCLERF